MCVRVRVCFTATVWLVPDLCRSEKPWRVPLICSLECAPLVLAEAGTCKLAGCSSKPKTFLSPSYLLGFFFPQLAEFQEKLCAFTCSYFCTSVHFFFKLVIHVFFSEEIAKVPEALPNRLPTFTGCTVLKMPLRWTYTAGDAGFLFFLYLQNKYYSDVKYERLCSFLLWVWSKGSKCILVWGLFFLHNRFTSTRS